MKLIKHYPYRTARVSGVTMVLPRWMLHSLERELARQAGVMPDNHTVYTFTDENRRTVAVFFTDGKAIFGDAAVYGRY